ncbi:redox-regulated ATPase YchF [Candidatus Poribacteria bacterium]|nr:redox-regulated ATPase YchF [Candidatus Poribacteria bacterium]
MKVAIIGLHQSGKTTVFKSLVGAVASPKNSHGQGIHVGNVKVPDNRLDRLVEIFNPPKIVHADIDFMDMAGARPDEKGTGLTPQVIIEMRSADAIVAVVRAFNNPSVPHPLDTIDPLRDMKNIEAELNVTDMIQIENRLQRMARERSDTMEKEALLKAKECLDAEKPLRLLDMNETEIRILTGFHFLSRKPLLLLLNISEQDIGKPPGKELTDFAERNDCSLMPYCAEVELEISELQPDEQAGFLVEMGLHDSGKDRFVRKVYEMLRLISFFTAGETEVHAWSVAKGIRAINAAGKVHSDMERGFIRAEIINFEDFVKIGSMQAARESGHLRLEGKDYEVCDGDMVVFRFNV